MPGEVNMTPEQFMQLRQMNEDSVSYGMERLSVEEVEGFRDPMMAESEESANMVRSRIKEMMLVDTESAEALQTAYPELFNEVRQERETLEHTANLGGLEKIKNDTLGKKKSAAKKRLASLKVSQEKLKKQRDIVNDRKKTESEKAAKAEETDPENVKAYREQDKKVAKMLDERRAALKKEYEKVTDLNVKARIKKTLRGLIENKMDSTAFDKYDLLSRGTEYTLKVNTAQDDFLSRPLVKKADGSMTCYDADEYFRDTARFSTQLGKADEADPNVMVLYAEATYIMLHGSKPDAEYETVLENKKQVKRQKKATEEESYKAFCLCDAKLTEKVDDLKEFRKKHDKIFAKNPSPKDLLTEFPLINEYYKGLQVTLKTITTLRNSDFVKSGGITADQLADLKEKQRYASSMTTYIITAFAYVKKYSAYSAGLGEKPADITQTFEEIYDKKVVN